MSQPGRTDGAGPASPSRSSAAGEPPGGSSAPGPGADDDGVRAATEQVEVQTGSVGTDFAIDGAEGAEPVAGGPSPSGTGTPRSPTQRRGDGPRRIRHGLKLRKRSDQQLPWVAAVWKAALERDIPPVSRAEGLEYARLGQVVTLFILPPTGEAPTDTIGQPPSPTRVEAVVQGRSARPYTTVIEIAPWPRQRWEQAIEMMAREAIYSAKLLAGEIPSAVEELCRTLGAPLLPAESELFQYRCTCPNPVPCKHHGAALAILVDRLIDQSLLAFNLRGMPYEMGMARLQEARTLHTHGRSTAHGAAGAAKAPVRPFEACFADFWRPGQQLGEFQRLAPPAHVPHALLRRLGPSPLQGKFPLVGLLASIYDSVRTDAERLRARADSPTGETGGEEETPANASDADADTLDSSTPEPS